MPSANQNANGNGNGPPNIPRGQLPDAITSTYDNRIADINKAITELTARQLSASQYVTATQAQIDALTAERLSLQGSVTP